MNVGILDLIAYTVPPEWKRERAALALRRHLYSVMPQAIAAWCRRLGHRVHYATHYGQADPTRLLPDDLDVVFLSASTQASALAYALAKVYRRAGTRTVLGGPHAKGFAADALRFFDVVVGECDESLVADILRGHVDPPAFVASARRPTSIPGVEERLPDLVAAGFRPGRSGAFNIVAVLGSLGCPYTCDFCTEGRSRFVTLPRDDLAADLRYLARHHPGAVVAYHDPNFAVRFDETMDVIEASGVPAPNRYVMECSLSVLQPGRLDRLRRTNCVFVAPGIESWTDHGNKLGAGSRRGRARLDHVVVRFEELHRAVPGLQANFLFGSDDDAGTGPADATIEFIRRTPFVWPNVNIPTPYGGTPLFDRYRAEGRILPAMPLACYCAPYLATTLKHYEPEEYYGQLLRIHEASVTWRVLARRLATRAPAGIRLLHLLLTLSHRGQIAETRRVLHLLRTDRAFRSFHEGRAVPLPAFYHRRYEQRLGKYAELISREERIPLL